ncbi:MAG: hypothetical protein EBR34_11860 [Sphingomonadaceae bacterium]|nr:hypothetical protein [Sphingomonadaceae bacterium]
MTSAPNAPKAPFAHIEAYPIALLGSPVSAEARALVDHLMHQVILKGEEGQRRPTSIQRTRRALGALLADLCDLLRGHADDPRPRLAAHGMSPRDFPAKALGFGRTIFTDILRSLQDAGLLSVAIGQPRWRKAFGKVRNFKGQTTTFQATPELIDLAASMGVEVVDWPEHWRSTDGRPAVPRPTEPRLELRGVKPRFHGKKQEAAVLRVEYRDPRVQSVLEGIHKLNEYLALQEIGGIAFPGLRRIFNEGERPGYSWNKGGRYYSLAGGHRYETLSAGSRLERIRFNGERVGEADIRASHMTLLHALMDRPLDLSVDPYHVEGIADRDLVKWWCTQAIGSSNPRPRQWASDKKLTYALRHDGRQLQQDYPIARVGEAVRARYPLLDELNTCGISTLDLQYHEAEILRLAMEGLMGAAVTVLPIHDGLIVTLEHLPLAERALITAFHEYVGGVIGHPPLVTPKVIPKLPKDRSGPG